jgi:hypothetical protein
VGKPLRGGRRRKNGRSGNITKIEKGGAAAAVNAQSAKLHFLKIGKEFFVSMAN